MKELHRAALGRVAKLGDLYDVRTDQFLSKSLLTGDPPESAVFSRDISNRVSDIVCPDSILEMLTKLEVEGDLEVSWMLGLVPLDDVQGYARYLLEERKDGGKVSGSMICSLGTKVSSGSNSQRLYISRNFKNFFECK